VRIFNPSVVIIDNDSLDFPIAKRFKKLYSDNPSTRYQEIDHEDICFDQFQPFPKTLVEMKSTLVVTRRYGFAVEKVGEGTYDLASDYIFNVVTGCPNFCSYCMQLYTLQEVPYIAIYPDLESAMKMIQGICQTDERRPLIFELGNMADMVELEPATGILSDVIRQWADTFDPEVQLQVVTKSDNVRNLLELSPKGTVRVGITLNLPEFIDSYEKKTAPLEQRLSAIRELLAHGYRIHLIFSPIFYREGVFLKYRELFKHVKKFLSDCRGFDESDVTIETLTFFHKKGGHHEILRHYPGVAEELMQYVECPEKQTYHERYYYPDKIFKELNSLLTECVETYFPKAQAKSIK